MKEVKTPEEVLARVLEDWNDGMGNGASMAADAVSGLRNAGYVIVSAPAYTRDHVSAAVNGAADVLPDHEYETSESIAQDDTANFIVNAALYLLDHPGADADEVIAAQYTDVEVHEEDLDDDEELPERGSPRWNEVVAEKVRGWITA